MSNMARRSGVSGWASIFPDLNQSERKPKVKKLSFKFTPKNSGQSQIPVLHNLEREFINLRKSRETWNSRVSADLTRIKFDFAQEGQFKVASPRKQTQHAKPSIMFANTDAIPEERRKRRRRKRKNLLQSAEGRTLTPSNLNAWSQEGEISIKKLNRQSKSIPKSPRQRSTSPKSPRRSKSPKSPRTKSRRSKSPKLSSEKLRRRSPTIANRPIITPPYRALQSQGSPGEIDSYNEFFVKTVKNKSIPIYQDPAYEFLKTTRTRTRTQSDNFRNSAYKQKKEIDTMIHKCQRLESAGKYSSTFRKFVATAERAGDVKADLSKTIEDIQESMKKSQEEAGNAGLDDVVESRKIDRKIDHDQFTGLRAAEKTQNDSFALSQYVNTNCPKSKPWRIKGRYREIKKINQMIVETSADT